MLKIIRYMRAWRDCLLESYTEADGICRDPEVIDEVKAINEGISIIQRSAKSAIRNPQS